MFLLLLSENQDGGLGNLASAQAYNIHVESEIIFGIRIPKTSYFLVPTGQFVRTINELNSLERTHQHV